MNEPRRHPDIFTEAEALEYMHLANGTERTLETLRRLHGLKSFRIGMETLYWRSHLDNCIHRMAGVVNSNRPAMQIGGKSA